MQRKQKKKKCESYLQWVVRIFPNWSREQKEIVCEMLKVAYIDGAKLIHELYADKQ